MNYGKLTALHQISVDVLTKDVADAFVEKVIVKPGQQVEILWKFRR